MSAALEVVAGKQKPSRICPEPGHNAGTLEEISSRLKVVWSAYKRDRIAVGRLLHGARLILKADRAFTGYLRENDIPRSTGYDLLRAYEDSLKPEGERAETRSARTHAPAAIATRTVHKEDTKGRIDSLLDRIKNAYTGINAGTRKSELLELAERVKQLAEEMPEHDNQRTTPATGGVIYVPKGAALEYAPLAVNVYAGCDHRCSYCYAACVTHTTKETFSSPRERENFLKRLDKDAAKLKPRDPVLLSFTCDAYSQFDVEHGITREAIKILHKHGHPITVLTKGGSRALRDIDLFTPRDAFASTLTFLDEEKSRLWEPGAAMPQDRIATLKAFHDAGIPTWASLEPVIDPDGALEIIKRTHSFVNLYKIGRWNHDARANETDWRKFVRDAVALLTKLDCHYLLKESLVTFLPDGVPPEVK